MMIMLLDSAIWMERSDIVDSANRVHDTPPQNIKKSYDFVIIGGGSAGAVLAARLSEIPNWNVLLLEAGDDESYLSELPLLFPTLQQSPVDWKFKTEQSNTYCLAMSNGQCNWPRGKVLGGSSVLNAMLYIRGNRKDYDAWEAAGNTGWGYEEVLHYLKKLENMNDPNYINDPLHNVDGPLTIEHFRYASPMKSVFMAAMKELNMLNPNGDFNGATQSGFAPPHGTIRDGLRCSTAKAYLRPSAHRPNLDISLRSTVEKILIHSDTKRAYGVLFSKNEKRYVVFAKKEIILSAGSIQSPHLLKLSGVGPQIELIKQNIQVVHHLPGVGENLQDHVASGGGTYLIQNPVSNSTLSVITPKMFEPEAIKEFLFNHTGPLYTMPACEVMGFFSTKYQNASLDMPDMQLFLASYSDNTDGGLFSRRASGMSFKYYDEVYEDIIYRDSFMVVPVLMRPKSRGKILLRSNNPNDKPLIYPNYFDDPMDLDVLVNSRLLFLLWQNNQHTILNIFIINYRLRAQKWE